VLYIHPSHFFARVSSAFFGGFGKFHKGGGRNNSASQAPQVSFGVETVDRRLRNRAKLTQAHIPHLRCPR